jgi:hypothetical protein
MKILLKRDASYIKPHWKPYQIHVSTSALGVGIRHISCKIFNYKVLTKRMLNVSQLNCIIGSLKYNSDDDKFINYDEVQEQKNPATCFQL